MDLHCRKRTQEYYSTDVLGPKLTNWPSEFVKQDNKTDKTDSN